MKKLLMVLPLVILLCFNFGCQKGEEVTEEPVVDVEIDIQALKNIEEEWGAALAAGDFEKVSLFYADNAILIPPNEPSLIGKKAAQEFMQKQLNLFTMEPVGGSLDDVQVSGNLAFTRGTSSMIYTPKAGGDSVTVNGNWICIYRKQSDGTWKCILNNWSDESLISPLLKEE